MSKYDPLHNHLKEKGVREIPLSFREIESIVGAELPASARKYRAWWSNNPGNSVMTHAWLTAGYRSAKVNLEGERVVFLKDENSAPSPEKQPKRPTGLFGCLSGTVKVSVEVDLTDPADPAWREPEVDLE